MWKRSKNVIVRYVTHYDLLINGHVLAVASSAKRSRPSQLLAYEIRRRVFTGLVLPDRELMGTNGVVPLPLPLLLLSRLQYVIHTAICTDWYIKGQLICIFHFSSGYTSTTFVSLKKICTLHLCLICSQLISIFLLYFTGTTSTNHCKVLVVVT